ncbi:precorrin-6y C5,15-methyltransferase (decarboxylating) subunit CbiE [Geoglobus acetivorans]|uniref:Cobalt-precorrin-6y C5-methyltransferase n=1 Tax=Geoglobus acetivorans TaxID=565033 RepID=A0A0A7GIV5_GEOAI|nr:Cobalt-precorrin-6y C5-methyltransferase [Geoglobus acetivorans]
MLFVVGVGLKKEHLTDEAKKAISRAEKVYGSERALTIAKEWVKGKATVLKRFDEDVYRKIEREGAERDVAVLSTGDPMVAGLGRFFKDAKIIPGISSVQIALARVKADICDVSVFNAHSQNPEFLGQRNMLILTRKGVQLDFPGKKMVILENLENENEKIYEVQDSFTAEENYTIVFVRVKE